MPDRAPTCRSLLGRRSHVSSPRPASSWAPARTRPAAGSRDGPVPPRRRRGVPPAAGRRPRARRATCRSPRTRPRKRRVRAAAEGRRRPVPGGPSQDRRQGEMRPPVRRRGPWPGHSTWLGPRAGPAALLCRSQAVRAPSRVRFPSIRGCASCARSSHCSPATGVAGTAGKAGSQVVRPYSPERRHRRPPRRFRIRCPERSSATRPVDSPIPGSCCPGTAA